MSQPTRPVVASDSVLEIIPLLIDIACSPYGLRRAAPSLDISLSVRSR